MMRCTSQFSTTTVGMYSITSANATYKSKRGNGIGNPSRVSSMLFNLTIPFNNSCDTSPLCYVGARPAVRSDRRWGACLVIRVYVRWCHKAKTITYIRTIRVRQTKCAKLYYAKQVCQRRYWSGKWTLSKTGGQVVNDPFQYWIPYCTRRRYHYEYKKNRMSNVTPAGVLPDLGIKQIFKKPTALASRVVVRNPRLVNCRWSTPCTIPIKAWSLSCLTRWNGRKI